MKDLIKALRIFAKYGNPEWPTHCEHDVLHVCIDKDVVSVKDKVRLDALGFYPDLESGGFISHKFGSA